MFGLDPLIGEIAVPRTDHTLKIFILDMAGHRTGPREVVKFQHDELRAHEESTGEAGHGNVVWDDAVPDPRTEKSNAAGRHHVIVKDRQIAPEGTVRRTAAIGLTESTPSYLHSI